MLTVPLKGGITNTNYVVEDGTDKYVVRVGFDNPLHQIMRFNELSASQAAYEAGLSPGIFYSEPGILVIHFIEGKTLTPEDIQSQEYLDRLVSVIKSCHQDIPKYLRGPALFFWVFHVLRDYSISLQENVYRHTNTLPELMRRAEKLESAVGPIEVVYGHNDLLASNFIDDGSKIWLIDWDYAGFNSPLFDLGGLASNNGLQESQEKWVLEAYFEKPVTEKLWQQYFAMKCASILREAVWSMVSEQHSTIDFDYATYTDKNLSLFHQVYEDFLNL